MKMERGFLKWKGKNNIAEVIHELPQISNSGAIRESRLPGGRGDRCHS